MITPDGKAPPPPPDDVSPENSASCSRSHSPGDLADLADSSVALAEVLGRHIELMVQSVLERIEFQSKVNSATPYVSEEWLTDVIKEALEPEFRSHSADLQSQLEQQGTFISSVVAKLHQSLLHKLTYEQTLERELALAHDELREYKSDLVAQAKRPIVDEIIRLHRQIGSVAHHHKYLDKHDVPREELAVHLENIQEDIELLLERHDIDVFEEEGYTLNPHRQYVVDTIDTSDPSLEGKIAERLAPGFHRDRTLLQREQVVAYRLVPLSQASDMPIEPPAERSGSLGEHSSDRPEGNSSQSGAGSRYAIRQNRRDGQ